MERLIRWAREAFVVSTVALLVLIRVGPLWQNAVAIPEALLAAVTVLTLPLAAISVWRSADRASRRNWLILLGVCLLLLASAVVSHQ